MKHYHAENGRFCNNLFIQDIQKQGQSISYCGVGAHHQNGIAEKQIRDLAESARKMILYAESRWPSAINTALWPYTLRQAQELMNSLPYNEDGHSPIETFLGTDIALQLGNFHVFGCPVFALDPRLQGSQKIPR